MILKRVAGYQNKSTARFNFVTGWINYFAEERCMDRSDSDALLSQPIDSESTVIRSDNQDDRNSYT